MLDELRRAEARRLKVRITVSDCLHSCCSRPPSRRAGYLQVYEGYIASVTEKRIILHALGLGTLNYQVLAEVVNIDDVVLVD